MKKAKLQIELYYELEDVADQFEIFNTTQSQTGASCYAGLGQK